MSVRKNNLDPVLAKILIKERDNSTQLADYGIDYFEGDLCYPVYGGKQTSVLRNGCEVLEKKNNQILKMVKIRPICPEMESSSLISEIYSVRRNPNYTNLLLNKFNIQNHNKYLF